MTTGSQQIERNVCSATNTLRDGDKIEKSGVDWMDVSAVVQPGCEFFPDVPRVSIPL